MKTTLPAAMKRLCLLLTLALLSVSAACREKTLGDKVDDALDQRPGEKVRDAGEDVKDAVKDATN